MELELICPQNGTAVLQELATLEPPSRCGDNFLGIRVNLSQKRNSKERATLEPPSRFGDKFLGIGVNLSPQRERGSKMVKT